MRKTAVITLLFAAFLHLAPFPVHGAARLTILHVNDLHGRILPSLDRTVRGDEPVGGAAYLACMVERERTRNPGGTLLLSAGDMFQGTPVSDLFRGRPVLEVMNRLGFDAMALGNHEFDWGRQVLAGIIKGARFPVLSANIVDRRGRYLPGVKPYVTVERKGIKIALIGLTTPETPYATKGENVRGLSFLDPLRVLPRLLREVRRQGARVTLVLSHLGLDRDRELAAGVAGIDVIVGGHSHTKVADPIVVGRTRIVQAGAHGLYLGVLELSIDERTGRVVGATGTGELRLVSAGPADEFDPEIARIAATYREKIKARLERVVGETTEELTRHPQGESNLGDLITDAMRASAHAEIAIHNSGGIRADIPAGRITMEQVYTALPFDDALVTMDLSGEALLTLFERVAGRDNWGMLQVSGMKIGYDAALANGRKVSHVLVNGAALDPAKAYRVVTNDFLAAGGDGLAEFKKGSHITYGEDLREVVVDYLLCHSPLAPATDERIVVLGR
jgi:2',3'-cyclic-nucleotide 2'-phosphodiesterase (5'-nucleotidase family)